MVAGAHKLSAFRILYTVSKRTPEVRSPGWVSTGLNAWCRRGWVPSVFHPYLQPHKTLLSPSFSSGQNPESHTSYVLGRHSATSLQPQPFLCLLFTFTFFF